MLSMAPKLPYILVFHSGVLPIGPIEIRMFRNDDEEFPCALKYLRYYP
jgi:hypothetical protein